MGKVQALGPIVVSLSDNTVVSLPGKRTREVVAALASGAGHPVQRQTVWNWLWPEMSKENARRALNTELWRLRQAVNSCGGCADDLIASTPDALRLRTDRGFDLDLCAFNTIPADSNSVDCLVTKQQLYKGDFAAGIEGEWIETIRRELRGTYLRLLREIVDSALNTNRLAEAQLFADRLVNEDPYDEKAARRVIRIALARGDHSAAAQAFRALTTRLKDDLDVRPSAKTVALYQQCQEGTDDTFQPPGFRIEPAVPEQVAVADARRTLLVIADLVTAIRSELRTLAQDLEQIGR